ncbi:MAG: DnaA/Hda family protein [Nanoarchaeota archaeon]
MEIRNPINERSIWSKSGIGLIYHNLSIDNYRGDPDAKEEVVNYIKNLHKMKEQGLGIMAFGAQGLGKSMLMVEILKAAARLINPKTRVNYSVYMTSLSEIVSTFTEGWNSPEKKREFRSKILNTDFLLIDDAEKVYMPKSENNIVISVTDETLRKRVNNLKPVLLTSNESPKELSNIFGPSIGSLLAGSIVPIRFSGNDYRRENSALKRWKEIYPNTKL